MKNTTVIVIGSLVIIVGVLLITLYVLFISSAPTTYREYAGTIVFDNEQDYTVFKETLSDKAVDIKEIQSLSSAPPIIVKYRVNAMDFPYGEPTSKPVSGWAILHGLGVVLLSLGAIALATELYCLVSGVYREKEVK